MVKKMKKVPGAHWGFLLLLKDLKFGPFCFGFMTVFGQMKTCSFGSSVGTHVCVCVCVCVGVCVCVKW